MNLAAYFLDHNLPARAGKVALRYEDACFTFAEMFPGGFTPRVGGKIIDQSAVAGLRGNFSYGLRYDVCAAYGSC